MAVLAICPINQLEETFQVLISIDGQILAVTFNGMSGLWQSADGEELRFWQPHQGEAQALSFSPDGRLLVSGDWEGNLALSDPDAGAVVHTLNAHQGMVVWAFFDSQGRVLVSDGADGILRVRGIGE